MDNAPAARASVKIGQHAHDPPFAKTTGVCLPSERDAVSVAVSAPPMLRAGTHWPALASRPFGTRSHVRRRKLRPRECAARPALVFIEPPPSFRKRPVLSVSLAHLAELLSPLTLHALAFAFRVVDTAESAIACRVCIQPATRRKQKSGAPVARCAAGRAKAPAASTSPAIRNQRTTQRKTCPASPWPLHLRRSCWHLLAPSVSPLPLENAHLQPFALIRERCHASRVPL